MIVVTVARKSLTGTVIQTVLTHGTGALNLDACRVATDWSMEESVRMGHVHKKYASNGVTGWGVNKGHAEPHAAGRWPANFLLQHLPECQRTGSGFESASDLKPQRSGFDVSGGYSHAHQVGQKVVASETWACVTGCPALALDEQSGVRPSPHLFGISDSGTASRYFKQVK